MQTFADGTRRDGFELRRAYREAASGARRSTCASCGRRRVCAPVDLADDGSYCLASCWPYQLGRVHGERQAAYLVRRLVTRELDRVFDPAAVEASGWPRYRCDVCGQLAPAFATIGELRARGWRELGRDAHLCPTCRPGHGLADALALAAALAQLLGGGA